MKMAELIFIPSPGAGHLFSTLEMAKTLLDRDDELRLSITVLIMHPPYIETTSSASSVPSEANLHPRLQLIDLPKDDEVVEQLKKSPDTFFKKFIESQALHVGEIVAGKSSAAGADSPRLAGFVLDMFCVAMMEVAEKYGIPSYVFFTSNASLLGLMFYIQERVDEHAEDFTRYKNSDAELPVPCFSNPIPARVLPSVVVDGGPTYETFVELPRRFRQTRGIILNTFSEIESHSVHSLLQKENIPSIYPVGPLLHLDSNNNNNSNKNKDEYEDVMGWLDSQPPSSVVFLCFGSMGAFEEKQVKEIANALENCGHRFLWSLRKRPTTGHLRMPTEYTNLDEDLPEGFLERTRGIGKVIGWAPQVAVLSHPSVGGFVSHCGWNSTLESVWHGVPMAAWPLYAEQQMNAFLLVKELGMAVEIKMDFFADFKSDITSTVSVEEIEGGIRKLMVDEGDVEFRNKVKDMKEKSRAAIVEGGSSYIALGRLIDDIIGNIA